jgi:hypothetical protein
MHRAPRVINGFIFVSMLPSVDLNEQAPIEAAEIGKKRPTRMVAPKFEAFQPAVMK